MKVQSHTGPSLTVAIPAVPAKYSKFIESRQVMLREIASMSKLGVHPNVLRLEETLEFVQDSKTTLFLVLELACGGELFDRCAARTARG